MFKRRSCIFERIMLARQVLWWSENVLLSPTFMGLKIYVWLIACFDVSVLLLVVGWFTGARAIPLIGGGVPWLIAHSLPQLQQQNQPSTSRFQTTIFAEPIIELKRSGHMHVAHIKPRCGEATRVWRCLVTLINTASYSQYRFEILPRDINDY